jgi:hypothetical protein
MTGWRFWQIGLLCLVMPLANDVRAQAQPHYLTHSYFPSPLPSWYEFLAVSGDVDFNGTDDVVVASGYSITTFPGRSIGGFESPVVTPFVTTTGYTIRYTALGDTNHDVFLDVIAYEPQVGHHILHGDGTGYFFYYETITGASFTPATVVDLDGDGSNEIVIQVISVTPAFPAAVLETYSLVGGTYTRVASYPMAQALSSHEFVDLDANGTIDLVGLTQAATGVRSVCVASGNGTGGFGPIQLIPFPTSSFAQVGYYGLATADINGDGPRELLLSLADYVSSISTAIHAPTELAICDSPLTSPMWRLISTTAIQGSAYYGYNPMKAVDINGDGFVDLVSMQASSNTGHLGHPMMPISRLGVALGDGFGGFLPSQVLDLPGTRFIRAFVALDHDGDGDVDFFGADWYWGDGVLFHNASRFGEGCRPSGGPVQRIRSGVPTPGNAQFSLMLDGAQPVSTAILGVSRAYTAPSGLCQLSIDIAPHNLILPSGTFGFTQTDSVGHASVPLPIPPDPGLVGTALYAQWAIMDASAGGIALSQAAMIILW